VVQITFVFQIIFIQACLRVASTLLKDVGSSFLKYLTFVKSVAYRKTVLKMPLKKPCARFSARLVQRYIICRNLTIMTFKEKFWILVLFEHKFF